MRPRLIAATLAVALATSCGRGPGSAENPAAAPATSPVPAAPDLPTRLMTSLDPTLLETLQSARSTVLREPAAGEAWGRFGQALEAAELFPEAQLCYRRAVELSPTSPRWAHLLGLLELQAQNDAAIGHLTRAADLAGGTNDAPRLRLAQALFERGQSAAATPHLLALLEHAPDHAAARLELARIRLSEQKPDDAATLLTPCVTNPYTARAALLLLSQIRSRQGNPDEGAALGRRAAAMPKPFDWPDPYLREVQGLRADRARQAEKVNALLTQKRFAEADTLLADLLRQLPADPELLLLSGRSRLLQRKCAEAEEQFRAHLRSTGNSLNGLTQLALALLCQQRWQDAADVLQQAIALKSDFAQAHANLGLARSRLGDTPGALASYRDALRCNPGDAATHAALAEELLRSGQRTEAAQEAARALQLDPTQARAKAVADRLR